MDVFKKFYSELTKVLPMIINNLVTKLYSDKLLSDDHKGRIDSMPIDEEKTEYFLNKVIKPGLEIEYTKLFDAVLGVMRTSDDSTINYLVSEIQKYQSAASRSLIIDDEGENKCTPKGNLYTVSPMHETWESI